MNRILLNAHMSDSSREFGEAGAYAVLTLTEELLRTIAIKRKMFLTSKQQYTNLSSMSFKESSLLWYEIGAMTPKQHEDNLSFDTLLDLLVMPDGETGDWVEFTDTVVDQPCTMEMEQLIINEQGIRWTASPINENYLTTTPLITYDQLFDGRW